MRGELHACNAPDRPLCGHHSHETRPNAPMVRANHTRTHSHPEEEPTMRKQVISQSPNGVTIAYSETPEEREARRRQADKDYAVRDLPAARHTIDLAQVAICIEADAALIDVLLGPDKTEAVDLVLHRIEHMMLVLRAIGEVPVPVVESAGE